jgi:hypothetical protein
VVGYFNSLLQQFGIDIPPQLTAIDGNATGVLPGNQWGPVMSLPPGVSDAGLPHATGLQSDCHGDCHGDHDHPGDRHQGVGELQLR